jgi:hypothetical protein
MLLIRTGSVLFLTENENSDAEYHGGGRLDLSHQDRQHGRNRKVRCDAAAAAEDSANVGR